MSKTCNYMMIEMGLVVGFCLMELKHNTCTFLHHFIIVNNCNLYIFMHMNSNVAWARCTDD